MTRDDDFKRLVRDRMRATGESYTAARAALLRRKEGVMVPVTVQVRVQNLTDEEMERWSARTIEIAVDLAGSDAEKMLVLNSGRQQPWLVLSEIDGERTLSIACGPVEAAAVAFAKQGVVTPRPMTHDLLRDVVETMGHAREVRITELKDNTFFAELVVSDNAGQERSISCRPSDGIALAVRANIPILVNDDLFPDRTVTASA